MDLEKQLNQLYEDASEDLSAAFSNLVQGLSTTRFHLKRSLPMNFILEGELILLRVKAAEIVYQGEEVRSLRITTKTDFKNILRLAEFLGMKMSAFQKSFTVILSAIPEALAVSQDYLLTVKKIEDLFIVSPTTGKPIFTDLQLFKIERISQ
jgi:hypothetical protein